MTVGGVRMMKMYSSCPGFPSGGAIRVKHKHTIRPSLQLPAYNWRSAGPGMSRSWCFLSITGLAALGSAKRYGTLKHPSSAKSRPAGSFSFSQPGGLPFWVVSLALGLIGYYSQSYFLCVPVHYLFTFTVSGYRSAESTSFDRFAENVLQWFE
jgi:hypothetical protein